MAASISCLVIARSERDEAIHASASGTMDCFRLRSMRSATVASFAMTLEANP